MGKCVYTCDVILFADLVEDPFGFFAVLEGALGSVEVLFDGLRVDVSAHLLHDADCEGGDLLEDQVLLLPDEPQQPDEVLLLQRLHLFLVDHVLYEEARDHCIGNGVRRVAAPAPIRATFFRSIFYNYDNNNRKNILMK